MARAKRFRSTKPQDPLIAIGVELTALSSRFNELDTLPQSIRPEVNNRDVEMKDLEDRISVIRDYISAVRATSLEGCLLQAKVLRGLCDMMGDRPSERLKEECEIRARRIIHSIINFIEARLPARAVADTDFNDFSAIDPWTRYGDVIERLRETREAA